jgi:hypothetical protein
MSLLLLLLSLLLPALTSSAMMQLLGAPPAGMLRSDTSYGWCDCEAGTTAVSFWPTANKSDVATLRPTAPGSAIAWLQFSAATDSISWSCNGSSAVHITRFATAATWWSGRATTAKKEGPFGLCGAVTGRLKWNTFEPAPTSARVSLPFSSFDDGYACMKIPVLLATAAGTLIAFAEARNPDCGDFSSTALVYKRSHDHGLSWSKLAKLVFV